MWQRVSLMDSDWGLPMAVAGVAMSLLILLACLGVMLVAPWAADTDVVKHEVAGPNGEITALVIADDCGATCDCAMRVDLKTADQYIREVYRSFEACDAEVRWMSATELWVEDDGGGEELIKVQEWGISP